MSERLVYRAPVESEARQVTDLVIACDIADFGQPDFALEDLLDIWRSIDLSQDAVAAVRSNGDIVGYAFWESFGDGRIDVTGVVHPDWRGRGIGGRLVRWGEERTTAWLDSNAGHAKAELTLNHVVPFDNPSAVKLMDANGYRFERLFCRMGLALHDHPRMPADAPEGLRFRPYRPGEDDEALHATYRRCFGTSWGYADLPTERWLASIGSERLDPELWTVAEPAGAEGEIAGFALMNASDGSGFVRLLGVDARYRQRGVGLALLRRSFELARARGLKDVLLGVDSDNESNAKRLYEKAGMRALFTLGVYQKKFRR